MTLIKVESKDTCAKRWAKDRRDIRSITKLSESAITNAMRALNAGKIFATRKFIMKNAVVDEASIKEVAE